MASWETSGRSDEWYTPKYIFEALNCHFDLDVAAPMRGPLHVPCDTWFYDCSLSKPWHGFVWGNFPFGGRNGLEPWLEKFFAHGNGIALTPDRTSAPWFRNAWASADLVLFMPKVRFIRPDGSEGKSPSTGTALWAVGPQAVAALQRAASVGLGILAQPIPPAASFAVAQAGSDQPRPGYPLPTHGTYAVDPAPADHSSLSGGAGVCGINLHAPLITSQVQHNHG